MKAGGSVQFSELLDQILLAHNVRSSEICNALGLKKAYFSRIRNGTLIPPSFDLVDEIRNVVGMTDEEYKKLTFAYQAENADGRYQSATKRFINYIHSNRLRQNAHRAGMQPIRMDSRSTGRSLYSTP